MTETPYFPILTKPIRDGYFKTLDHSGDITMREFKDGWFGLPDAFIVSWCGLTERAK